MKVGMRLPKSRHKRRMYIGKLHYEVNSTPREYYIHCTFSEKKNALHGQVVTRQTCILKIEMTGIIESVDSISRDEPDSPQMQYITNAGISCARYTITDFKHHYRVLQLISNRMSV